MRDKSMIVIGADPGANKSTVFDGKEIMPYKVGELKIYLDGLKKEKESVLVCWDSPLTGPKNTERVEDGRGEFSQRIIERFFSRGGAGQKPPSGISVVHYSGCSHWAMTRAILGLPRCGLWDTKESDLPFRLLTESEFPKKEMQGRFVVEVHPALAAWFWCEPSPKKPGTWQYKKDDNILQKMWEIIQEKIPDEAKKTTPKNDDELDAVVAYSLGVLWTQQKKKVFLLGDRSTGSFLLPINADLKTKFDAFRKN